MTNTPEAVVELLFKGKHTPKDIDTYEKLRSLIDSTDFKYPSARTDIYQDFEQKVEDAKLPIPNEL